MNIGHVCHPNQGSECLGCLHSCWSPLSPHGPQARVRPSHGKISNLTFMSHLHQYHEDNHQNEKIHFQQTLSFSFHREGLPLTMKSCFYPLIGDRIFGWPGDLVDMIRFGLNIDMSPQSINRFFYTNPKTKLYFQRYCDSVRGLHKSGIGNYADQQRPPSSTGA